VGEKHTVDVGYSRAAAATLFSGLRIPCPLPAGFRMEAVLHPSYRSLQPSRCFSRILGSRSAGSLNPSPGFFPTPQLVVSGALGGVRSRGASPRLVPRGMPCKPLLSAGEIANPGR